MFHLDIGFCLSVLWSLYRSHLFVIYLLSIRISIRARCTTLCDKVCQWLATGWWFSPGLPVSSTNKTDHHDITEMLLEVALNTIKQTNKLIYLCLNIPHIIDYRHNISINFCWTLMQTVLCRVSYWTAYRSREPRFTHVLFFFLFLFFLLNVHFIFFCGVHVAHLF